MPVTNTLLRYPGGKSQMTPFVLDLMRANGLFYGSYAEPFAGGAGIACNLLFDGYVSEIFINDLDPAIHAFWSFVVSDPEEFSRRLRNCTVSLAAWRRHRRVLDSKMPDPWDLGFAAFFLNRTNRSGIIRGGVIGGQSQQGNYLIDCRFNKKDLLRKVERLASHAEQIHVSNLDAKQFLRAFRPKDPASTLINIDPPYYVRGPELYSSWFDEADHVSLAREIPKLKAYWMITYDDTDKIRRLYSGQPCFSSYLRYSAQVKRSGKEILVLDPRLVRPDSLSRLADPPAPRSSKVRVHPETVQA